MHTDSTEELPCVSSLSRWRRYSLIRSRLVPICAAREYINEYFNYLSKHPEKKEYMLCLFNFHSEVLRALREDTESNDV